MASVAASRVRPSFTEQIARAYAAAGKFAEERMIEATYRDNTERADQWALAMASADDQAAILAAFVAKGWL